MSDRFQQLRVLEAILFASAEPMSQQQLSRHLPEGCDCNALVEELRGQYANRGVNLVAVGDKWAFRTAEDLAPYFEVENKVGRKPTRAAVETLAIIAYHQPITRAEIEEVRGVALSKGTLDSLLEAGWVRPRGRRRTPGRPVTWGTTDRFLDQFGLENLDALPGIAELKAAGLIDSRPAIAALSSRGALTELGEGEDTESGEDLLSDEEAERLAADFGEDLVETASEEEHESASADNSDDEDGEEESDGGAAINGSGDDEGDGDHHAEEPSKAAAALFKAS